MKHLIKSLKSADSDFQLLPFIYFEFAARMCSLRGYVPIKSTFQRYTREREAGFQTVIKNSLQAESLIFPFAQRFLLFEWMMAAIFLS